MKIVRNQHGFKLLELIIVMGIITILTGAFTTGYIQFKSRSRVKTAIRQIIMLQKALNNMANVCQGYPIRERANVNDMNSLLPIVDLTECKGNTISQEAANPLIYPSQKPCPGETLGSEILHSYNKTTLTVQYHSTSLCKSSCSDTDTTCQSGMGENFYHAFITVAGQSCSPQYGSPSGAEFPGNYQPGWNYVLLHNNTVTSAVDKPVGVICGMALGYKTAVKIVVNTSGYYAGDAVPEGSGMYDVDGSKLANFCPCGPWCQDLTNSAHPTGCCSPCENQPGVGYRF
jgi:type II secretory pathway pseudopilin PulG